MVDPVRDDLHLSQIETAWTMVFRAHRGPADASAEAQRVMMERYGGAVRRYLSASLGDPDAASDLAQEFALRFLRGDFHRADPERGRFRDFVKRAVYHLMVDYHRRRRSRPRPLADDVPDPVAPDDGLDGHDGRFLENWRKALMARAWDALARSEAETGRPLALLLRLRVDHPELRSPEMAERLSERMGRPVNAGWVRLNLHRARDLFVDLLLREVAQSLGGSPGPDRLEEELADLGLLDYCRPAMRRLGHGH